MNTQTSTTERLIDSAIELMYARSYADVGVQELCRKAAVQKGSFYHFFPSKQDLALSALDHMFNTLEESVLIPAYHGDLPVLAKIERHFELLFAGSCSVHESTGHIRGCFFGNLAVELSTQDEIVRIKVENLIGKIAAYVQGALEDGVAAGELPPDTDVQSAAQSVVAYMEGVLLLAKVKNDPSVIARLAKGATKLVRV